jgi:C-methyltransferase
MIQEAAMSFTAQPATSHAAGLRAHGEQATEQQRAAAATMLPMIWGIHISRAVYVVAELGIADLLASGPVSSRELGRATHTHEPSLYRVLRLLAALGVFSEDEPRVFSLTVLGERLRSDDPACVRSWARLLETVGGVRPFEHILDTLRTGNPGVETAFGMNIFQFLAQHPANAVGFDAAMSERTAAFAPSVAAEYDFSEIRTVVDLGGGVGILLEAILRRHPHLHGALLETAPVAARARRLLSASDIADRCEVVSGDFFKQIPDGADCYVMANVLHDWDDARALQILSNCRRSIPTGGRVLIVERLIPDDPSEALPTLLSDINMLILTGGQERTNAEYGKLLTTAGLYVGKVTTVAFPYGVIEGLRA